MQLIFLVIQIILAVAIIGTVLLQKNGGDSLGSLGGGGGMNGNSIISGRASANFLTKATTILMVLFMVNSLVLGNLAMHEHNSKSVVEKSHSANKSKHHKKEQHQEAPIKLEEHQVPVSD